MEVVTYTDGLLTVRALGADDLEMHLDAIDDEQIDWLWEPGDRAKWEALSPEAQRAHQLRFLEGAASSFGPGPVWRFAVDTSEVRYVAYVDCNLANNYVPLGQANVSYTVNPRFRGRGYASGGVRLVLRFLRERTPAEEAHIVVDPRNTSSLRVARAVGAVEVERFVNDHGLEMIRHVIRHVIRL